MSVSSAGCKGVRWACSGSLGATAAQLNFPSSPEKLRASAEACGTGAGGEVSRSLSSAFTDFAQRAAAASAPQDSQASGSAQLAVTERASHAGDHAWVHLFRDKVQGL